jgi:hypothetical protein
VEKIEGKKMDHLESILTKVAAAAAAAASNSLNGSGSLKRGVGGRVRRESSQGRVDCERDSV